MLEVRFKGYDEGLGLGLGLVNSEVIKAVNTYTDDKYMYIVNSKQHPQHHTTTHFVKMLMVLLCVTYELSYVTAKHTCMYVAMWR